MSKIDQVVQRISDILSHGSVLDAITGNIVVSDEAQEEALKAAGIDEIAEVYQKAVADIAAASRLSTAQVSKDAMMKNPELESTRSDIRIGRDTLTSKFYRSRDNRNPVTGETITSNWCSSSTFSVNVTKKVGQMRAVSEHIVNEMYADMATDA